MSKSKPDKKLSEKNKSIFECIICYEKKSNDNKIMSRCAHGPYCTECFNRILELSSECAICKHPLTDSSNLTGETRGTVRTLGTINLAQNSHDGLTHLSNILLNQSPVNSTIMHMIRELNQINNTSHQLNNDLSYVLEQTINARTIDTHSINTHSINSQPFVNQNISNQSRLRHNSNTNITIIDNNSDSSDYEDIADLSSITNYVNSPEHKRVGRKFNSNGEYSCNICRDSNPCDKFEEFAIIKTQLNSLIELMENIGN